MGDGEANGDARSARRLMGNEGWRGWRATRSPVPCGRGASRRRSPRERSERFTALALLGFATIVFLSACVGAGTADPTAIAPQPSPRQCSGRSLKGDRRSRSPCQAGFSSPPGARHSEAYPGQYPGRETRPVLGPARLCAEQFRRCRRRAGRRGDNGRACPRSGARPPDLRRGRPDIRQRRAVRRDDRALRYGCACAQRRVALQRGTRRVAGRTGDADRSAVRRALRADGRQSPAGVRRAANLDPDDTWTWIVVPLKPGTTDRALLEAAQAAKHGRLARAGLRRAGLGLFGLARPARRRGPGICGRGSGRRDHKHVGAVRCRGRAGTCPRLLWLRSMKAGRHGKLRRPA